jgi:Tol biopolymer transport system component
MRSKPTIRALGVICGAGIALALTMPVASATFPGTNGKLAVEKGGISTVWANGTGFETGLRVAVRNAAAPAWSPDGTRIAFQRLGPDGFWHIWVKDMATGTRSQVTSNQRNDEGPAWSPDGTKIAFLSGGIYTIGSTRPFGRRHLVLALPSIWGSSFSDLDWSPNGTRLAFTYSTPGTGEDIAVVRPGILNAQPTFLTSGGSGWAPSWSPSGTRIAYSSGWLSVMNADGTNKQHFSNFESYMFNLTWSPDGRKIAAVIEWQYTTTIITMNPSTGAWINDDVVADVGDNLDWQPVVR